MNSPTNTISPSTIGSRYWTLAFQRLCWKESMQLAPLVLALLAINAMLHLLPFSNNAAELQGFHILLLNLMPCLFASGAGAMLVSQEKEHRTIGWLNSLPIASSQILYAKLLVGLVGLAIVWFTSFLTTLIIDRELPYQLVIPQDGGFSVQLTAINSIFLLFLGFATAWRWQSTLVGLVLIVPLAAFPTVAILAIQGLSRENRLSDVFVGLTYFACSGAFLWYGWRSGKSYLASKPHSLVWFNLLSKLERSGPRTNLLHAKPQGLASTLLWQFSVQNRMLWVALVALFVLPALVVLLQSSRDDMAMVAIPAWLIVSWLGSSVFQSDSVHQRVKFLAERGVAPRTIWWTRQIFPLGLILIATAISAILGMAILNGTISRGKYVSYGNYVMLPWMMLGGPAVLLAHAAAQWQGQLIRSSIMSLIIAPAITLAAIGYTGYAMVTFGAPYWMVFVPSLIAFTATRVMTGPWMDGRIGKKYWLGHGLFLVAALSIPALPFLVTTVLYPGMPNSGYQQFAAELNKYGRTGDSIELVLHANLSVKSDLVGSSEPGEIMGELEGAGIDAGAIAGGEANGHEPALGFVEQIKFNLVAIEEQLTHRSGAVRWSPAVNYVAAEAMLTRAQLDVDAKSEPSLDRYRTAMRILHDVLKRMRQSGRLIDQEGADRVECWMFEQASLPDAREMLGESNWTAITKTLMDKAGRKEARKRAIVQSSSQLDISGLTGMSSSGLAGWRGTVANIRRISRTYWLLLQYLESKDTSEADKRFAEVASAWGLPAKRNPQVGLSRETGFEIPGQNWFGEWENFRLDKQSE